MGRTHTRVKDDEILQVWVLACITTKKPDFFVQDSYSSLKLPIKPCVKELKPFSQLWGVGTHFLTCTCSCYHSCVATIARNCGFFWTQSSRGVFEHTWVLAKGVAYINGYNIGRYWPSMGPQLTLYVPGWPLTRFFKILSGNLGRTKTLPFVVCFFSRLWLFLKS